MCRINSTATEEQRRIIIFFVALSLVDVGTPDDFSRSLVSSTEVVKEGGVVEYLPAVALHIVKSTEFGETISSKLSSLSVSACTSLAVCWRSCEYSKLSLEGSNDTTVDLSTMMITKCLVIACHVGTYRCVFGRNLS